MLDIKQIRENPELFKKGIAIKQANPELIDQILKLDEEKRKLITESEQLKAEKNKVSKQIPQLQGEEKEKVLAEMKTLSDKQKTIEEELKKAEEAYMDIMNQLPNPAHESVPEGEDDEDNQVARLVGDKPEFNFEPKEHWELGEALDIIDLERGAKVAGSRFYYLKNELVILEMALMNFVMQKLVKKGFTPMIPPYMVREDAMYGTGFFPADKNQIYSVNPGEDDLYLIGTSEVPVTAYYSGEILEEKDLGQKFVGYSPCFRREAGTYGKDMKGILRVHQFEKVEMVFIAHPDKSWEAHEEMREIEEEVLKDLGIPYQVVNICGGDLGGSAAKKYDLEAWLPGQGKYREMTSTSNCTDFQSRRLNIRYRDSEGKIHFVHTLNGTATSSRPLIAIMENYQQKDGSIKIPEVLRPLCGFDKIG